MSRFATKTIAAALAATSLAAPSFAQLSVTKSADLAKPVALAPGQGAILVGFRRPDKMSMGKSGAIAFSRYDVEGRDLVFQPRGAKKSGDTTTYSVLVKSKDRKQAVEYHLMPVSAGDYVLAGATPGPARQVINTFCLGAPTFRVNAGEVVYFGELTPYMMVKVVEGGGTVSGANPSGPLAGALMKAATAGRADAMAYSSNPDAARQALAKSPALMTAFRPAQLRNEATYTCIGQQMLAYQVPQATLLGSASASPAPVAR